MKDPRRPLEPTEISWLLYEKIMGDAPPQAEPAKVEEPVKPKKKRASKKSKKPSA